MMAVQLDLFAATPSVVVLPETDPLVERIVGAEVAPNEYLLLLNRAIHVAANDLPSRLFQWPVEFVDRARRDDGQSVLLLNHPDLAAMAFVDEIERRVGVRPHWESTDEYGRDRGERHRYYHALDLLTDKHWRDLLATRNCTDRDGIISGLKFHGDYGGLSIENTRAVLSGIGEDEPNDRSAAYLASDKVRITNAQQGQFVGFAHAPGDLASVWAAIHGLEARKFRRDKNGYLRFSPGFLAEKLGSSKAVAVESEAAAA
jgi:hypothetical protein